MKKILLLLIIFTNLSYSQINTEKYLKESGVFVYEWIDDLDNKNYHNCWLGIALELRENFDYQDYIDGLEEMMSPFGTLVSRKETSRKFKGSLENLPDGYYVIFTFESNYKLTLNHTERIILRQNNQRKWEVIDFSYEYSEINNLEESD